MNGTFGVGKTTTASAVVARSNRYRMFDPEHVGYLLMANLKGIEFADFQDLEAWRKLVPIVARHIQDISGQHLIAVQSVLNQKYWNEIRLGLAAEGMAVMHVVLDAEPQALDKRIESDELDRGAMQWRLDHVETYMVSRQWMLEDADLVIDVSEMTAEDAADLLIREIP